MLLPSYDQYGLLDRLDGRVRGAADVTTFAERIEYNARSQRTLIRYGNGTSSVYAYDPLVFRLARLTTRRGSRRLQDLRYTYDAVGNPTEVSDRAQQQSFFRNQVVTPSARYTYDALYRLTRATGREHLGQSAAHPPHPVPPGATDAPRVGLPQPGDGSAMARYVERYTYNAVGNLLLVRHRSADPAYGGWTRAYRYEEPSLLKPDQVGNRLTGAGPARAPSPLRGFGYDQQGNTTAMPEIPLLRWNFADRLLSTARQAYQEDDPSLPQTTYYVYNATGQRVRKVTRRAGAAEDGPATRKSERIYIGALEIFREYDSHNAVTLERETLNVLCDKQRLALVETRTAGMDPGPRELIRYQLANHLGSSVLELDRDAQVISYEEYYPYGSTSYQAVRASVEAPKRYRYTGKERDTETGLYYYDARYYIPWLARWASCDPKGLADGVNLYTYVRDNPIRYRDPSGRDADDSWHINWSAVGKGALIAGIAIVAVAAVVATAGAAAPLLASGTALALGATAETAAVAATAATGLVEAGTLTLGVVGAGQLATGTAEVVTGRDAVTGQKLTNDQRSEKLGGVAVGWAAVGLGAALKGAGTPSEISEGPPPETPISSSTAPAETPLAEAPPAPSEPATPPPTESATAPPAAAPPEAPAAAAAPPEAPAAAAAPAEGPPAAATPPEAQPSAAPPAASPPEPGNAGPSYYRGAKGKEPPDFTLKPGEYRITKTGVVRGLSLFDNPESLRSKGFTPHEVDLTTVPEEVNIEQRGTDPRHFEIVPSGGAFPPESEFQGFLDLIRVKF